MLENDFHAVIVNRNPLIDVRAPIEFVAGSIPNSVNLPLLNDEERHLVGSCYSEQGKAAALQLGQKLVSGPGRKRLISQWDQFVAGSPGARIFCARGGLRSEIAQSWIKEHGGKEVSRLEGGYKAFRQFLLDHLAPGWLQSRPVILGGRTGSGKTALLRKLLNIIDLEGIANHRGSSFGRFTTPQPGQADFENRLAGELILFEEKGYTNMILEDEGRHVGQRFLPKNLSTFFNSGLLVILDEPLEVRIQNTFQEYVISSQLEHLNAHGEHIGIQRWLAGIHEGVYRIAKRLGSQKYSELQQLIDQAQQTQLSTGDATQHKNWVGLLLRGYYDPMYDYQIEKKQGKVMFRGNSSEVLDYFASLG